MQTLAPAPAAATDAPVDARELGVREIGIGARLPPHRRAQPADTAEATARTCTLPGRMASARVPRLKGAGRWVLPDPVGQADAQALAAPSAQTFAAAGGRLACGPSRDTRGLGPASAGAAWQAA